MIDSIALSFCHCSLINTDKKGHIITIYTCSFVRDTYKNNIITNSLIVRNKTRPYL